MIFNIGKTVLIFTMGLISTLSFAEECVVKDEDIAVKYRGECRSGLASGQGHAEGRDIYVGSFKDGEPHGFGVYIWGSGSPWPGDIFEGQWDSGNRVNGKYKSKFGYVYEGGFEGSKTFGYGVLKVDAKTGLELFGENINKLPRENDFHVIEGLWIDNELAGLCSKQRCLEILSESLNKKRQ